MAQEDGIASTSGTAFIAVGSQNLVLFYLNKLEAKIAKNKVDVRVVGKRSVGKKTTSWAGTGTLGIKEVTSVFKEMMLQYTSGGEDVYFSIQVVNEDSKYGREVKTLTGCNFDEITIALLNNEDALLEQELPFTFDGVEMPEKFNSI
ncbi:MAG: phage tail tube protein [Candidatus Fimivivens sp.]